MAHWRLDGRRVLVTGGTKGIGEACVKEFLGLGAEVMLCSRSADAVEGKLKELGEAFSGSKIHGCVADVSTKEGARRIHNLPHAQPLWWRLWRLLPNSCRPPHAPRRTSPGRATLVANVQKTWGRLDVLINNVGTNQRA